jgi:hypothetical protein
LNDFLVVTIHTQGSVAEWSIAPVLKTGDSKGSVSSNLTASAKYSIYKRPWGAFLFSAQEFLKVLCIKMAFAFSIASSSNMPY